jgi:hypothetical protein
MEILGQLEEEHEDEFSQMDLLDRQGDPIARYVQNDLLFPTKQNLIRHCRLLQTGFAAD